MRLTMPVKWAALLYLPELLSRLFLSPHCYCQEQISYMHFNATLLGCKLSMEKLGQLPSIWNGDAPSWFREQGQKLIMRWAVSFTLLQRTRKSSTFIPKFRMWSFVNILFFGANQKTNEQLPESAHTARSHGTGSPVDLNGGYYNMSKGGVVPQISVTR